MSSAQAGGGCWLYRIESGVDLSDLGVWWQVVW
jgi:hypothetical protein